MSPTRPSKSRSRSQLKTLKSYRAGKVTRNPFLNFLRDYRVSNKGLTVTEVTSRGAEVWRSMTEQQKASYLAMAKQAPRQFRRRRSRKRRGRRRRRRGRRAAEESEYDESDSESGRKRNFCKHNSGPGSSSQR